MQAPHTVQDVALAHVRPAPEKPSGWDVHLLHEHLHEVARLAAERATVFAAEEWARLAGRWHDLGKYRPPFQGKIRKGSGFDPDAHIEQGGRANHSTAGALHAIETLRQRHGSVGELAGRVLAYLIASHHAGLYDWESNVSAGLKARLADAESRREYDEALSARPAADILADEDFNPGPSLKAVLAAEHDQPGAYALWVRMLFSALVDADFLDTERFMDPAQFERRGRFPAIAELRAAYDAHMARFGEPAGAVNQLRARVLAQCRWKASETPGAFSLTVPTGGGKTLASLGFALEHALRHGKRRIVYAIPYTSIIEQTTDVFRRVFEGLAGDPVIEHHSQAERDGDTLASRLACENWDAPLIVTTNVQLFESLFAARTSHCRKLHNLAGSVIVLDEAQQLPPEFLQPILDVLRLLIAHYGVTVVFCTATQPVLTHREMLDPRHGLRGFEEGQVCEIIDDPDALFDALKRVAVELPADLAAHGDWDEIAAAIAAEDCILAIVNRKSDARELWRRLPEGAICLTTDLCGAHRAALLAEIRTRLDGRRTGSDPRPLHVVSTSLIEAGVDVDFPVVWRALAGLDSIAQAAGRCNREGRLDGLGRVKVFVPPTGEPRGTLALAAGATRAVLHGYDDPDGSRLLADRNGMWRYFRRYYADCGGHDQRGIVDLLHRDVLTPRLDGMLAVAFRTAAERFRLIDDEERVTVYVCYPAGDEKVQALLDRLAQGQAERWSIRALQRYAVSVRKKDMQRMGNDLHPVLLDSYILINPLRYHPELGLNTEQVAIYNPSATAL
ncbi:CRISPR-associated endonuclease Cas3'' [Chitinimonas koreensis]|nr:CRISPR-associated endonuclease Cas3'' [Chitinimonas koreensis]QNM98360.1 CRISPR-associated endonuclease Cas3'' [Chitinimonas koreensis]